MRNYYKTLDFYDIKPLPSKAMKLDISLNSGDRESTKFVHKLT